MRPFGVPVDPPGVTATVAEPATGYAHKLDEPTADETPRQRAQPSTPKIAPAGPRSADRTKRGKGRKTVLLTLTEHCNLDCTYCFEKQKSKRSMDIQLAKHIVKTECLGSDDFDEIEFDLFGGEPTLRKVDIVNLVDWSLDQRFAKPHLFFLQTNGTLMDRDFRRWLHRRRGYVYVGLSLDGTPETQNKNRSNSYNRIDSKFFASSYPDQPVRMTVHTETVRNLFKDVVHLHELGFREIETVFASGVAWGSEQTDGIVAAELRKLCDYYLQRPDLKECSALDMYLPGVLQRSRQVQKWCGTGDSVISYAPDGTIYPCQAFQPMAAGAGKHVPLGAFDIWADVNCSASPCSDCLLEHICPSCYGMNYVLRGDTLRRDRGMCNIVKLCTLAAAYLTAKRIEQGVISLEPRDLYQTIKAIREVQRLTIIGSSTS